MATSHYLTSVRFNRRRLHRWASSLMVAALVAGLIPLPAMLSLLPVSAAPLAMALLPTPATAQAADAAATMETAVDRSVETAAAAPAANVVANAVPGGTAGTQITGNVFRDFNSDGLKSTGTITDTGVSGVTVTAYDATGAQAGVATTAGNGDYTITGLTAGVTYRLEFSTLPTGYYPTTRGSGTGDTNGTTVQFAAAGTSQVSLGINQPCDKQSPSHDDPLQSR